MGITFGFGFTFGTKVGATRKWAMGGDGIKRWLDNGEPCDKLESVPRKQGK